MAAHHEGVSAARLAEENSWSAAYTTRLLDAQASFGLLKKKLGPDNIGMAQQYFVTLCVWKIETYIYIYIYIIKQFTV